MSRNQKIWCSPKNASDGFEIIADPFIPEDVIILSSHNHMYAFWPKTGGFKDLGDAEEYLRQVLQRRDEVEV